MAEHTGAPELSGDEEGELRGIEQMTAEEVAHIAHEHGLRRVGSRPPFSSYLRDLWERRGFLWTFSSAKNHAKNEGQKLGQIWAVINPLLMILTYFLIFGLLLRTGRGVDNFIGYLSIGVVLFGFSASTLTSGSRAILNNTGLVRALHFPRAVLPLSTVLIEALALVPGLVVLMLILPLTGEVPSWKWLLFPVAFLLQTMMQAGMTLVLARIVHANVDVWNLIPVVVRFARYVSGVFFSIAHMTEGHPVIGAILDYQPLSLQLTLARQTLMGEFDLNMTHWIVGIAWALLLPAFGLWFFWRDEAKYGRG